MFETAITRNLGPRRGFHLTSEPEPALLGGVAPSFNRAKVMTANYQSCFISPADLDAFLRGFFQEH